MIVDRETRKEFKRNDRAKRRSIRARRKRTIGTQKPTSRKPGVKYSAAPAVYGAGLFRHERPQEPYGTFGTPIRLKRKYRL
jgi:hypothetical protein